MPLDAAYSMLSFEVLSTSWHRHELVSALDAVELHQVHESLEEAHTVRKYRRGSHQYQNHRIEPEI